MDIHAILMSVLALSWDAILDLGKTLYGVLICLQIVFGSDLLVRYFKTDKQTRKDAAYFAFYFIGSGVIATGAYNIVALYSYIYQHADWLLSLQVLIAVAILTIMATAAESAVQWRKWLRSKSLRAGLFGTIGVFGIIYALIGVVFEILDVDNIWVMWFYVPPFIAIVVLALVTFWGFLTIFQRIRPKRETSLIIIRGLFFGLIAAIGAGLRWFGLTWQTETYVWGFIVEIVGWTGFRAYILAIPSYSELEWRGGLIDLYLLFNESGILLYHQNFRPLSSEEWRQISESTRQASQHRGLLNDNSPASSPENPVLDKDLISSGIAGVQSLLKEITGARGGLHSVQVGNKFLISAQGQIVLAVVLAEKNLGVYHDLITRFVWDVEKTFPALAERRGGGGSSDEFAIAPVAERYFSTKISLRQKKL